MRVAFKKCILILVGYLFLLSCTPKLTKIALKQVEHEQFQEALLNLQNSIAEKPDYYRNYIYISEVYFRLNRYEDALQSLDDLLKMTNEEELCIEAESLRVVVFDEYERTQYNRCIERRNENNALDFIEKFPDSENKQKVESMLDSLRWEKACEANNKFAFEGFISAYPRSSFIQSANDSLDKYNEEEIYRNVINEKSLEACEFYLNSYPDGVFSTGVEFIRDSIEVIPLLARDDLVELISYLDERPNSTYKDTVNWMIENYYEPRDLGYPVNTEYDEWYPFISADNERLYFIGADYSSADDYGDIEPRTGGLGGEDIFVSIRNDFGKWERPEVMPYPINTANSNEGCPSMSSDYNELLFGRCGTISEGSCDISISVQDAQGEWSYPDELEGDINTYGWEADPCFSSDKKTIYFVGRENYLGGHKSKGDSDIFKATRMNDGTWGKVRNVSELNTKGSERGPFLHPDGKTIYFSSDGRSDSKGGSDIYIARLDKNGNWTNIENLGSPVNTYKDEIIFRVSSDGRRGYFDRRGLFGNQDIMYVNLSEKLRPEPVVVVTGAILDIDSEDTLVGQVKYYDFASTELIAESWTTEDRKYFVVVLPAGREYTIFAEAEGYFFQSKYYDIREISAYEKVNHDISLNEIKVGELITVNNILFDFNKSSLRKESKPTLTKIIDVMKKYAEMSLEIHGHTDNVGEDEYNMKLSERRASAVVSYLIQNGIPSTRLEYKGFGSSKPIASNETEEGRQENRRVEVYINDI